MDTARSRFGINLLAQFVLSLLLSGIAAQLPMGINTIASIGGTLLFILFMFGMLYGFFRLLGARSAGLEGFYQHFPFGMIAGSSYDAHATPDTTPSTPHVVHQAAPAEPLFDWRALCSFQTLRYAGVILIITAVFSLLFRIEWTLFTKICCAASFGVIFLACAEWLRRIGRVPMASISALLSFALFQFTLTLLFLYAGEQSWAPLLQSTHTWLTFKFLLSCAFLFTLWRYPSDVHPVLYFAIAYASPLTLLYSGAAVALPMGLVFLAAMSAIVLTWSAYTGRISVALLNAACVNLYIAILFNQQSPTTALAVLALVGFAAFFIVHLVTAVMHASGPDAQGRATAPQWNVGHLHLVAIHAFIVMGILHLRPSLEFLDANIGFALLAVALISFATSLLSRERIRDAAFNEVLLNLSILLSAAGLFLQTKDAWSAIVFLLYACAILWYSLYTTSVRMRIYGFLILGVSLVKLYLQFSDIFKSIPGSIAVIVIGILLIALSYEFEKIKDLVMEGLPHHPNNAS